MDNNKPNILDKLVENIVSSDLAQIPIKEIIKNVGVDMEETIGLLKLLESSKIISFLGEKNENGKILLSGSYLDSFNLKLHSETLRTRDSIENKRLARGYVSHDSYTVQQFKHKLFKNLGESVGLSGVEDINISFIDKGKFNGDISLKFPTLLSSQKQRGKNYIKDDIPFLINQIDGCNELGKSIENCEQKGMYINLSLKSNVFFDILNDVIDQGKLYGESDMFKGESIVVDYSSPNTAKHLHAGHIRSTIIGHVLSNIYEATGFTAHRVNHINDWGGFGTLLEGLQRWEKHADSLKSKNDMLFEIYSFFRRGEKIVSDSDEFNNILEIEREKLSIFYGKFDNYEEFCRLFNDFQIGASNNFKQLELGNKEEVLIWDKIVSWSMEDFAHFYNTLGIHQDYVIGESFYANMGRKIVQESLNEGKILKYNSYTAESDKNLLKEALKRDDITESAYKSAMEEIDNDIGAYVVRLNTTDRYVVLKGDKSTIYATRDLAAIQYRSEVFKPSRIVYEVGQEQAEHFDKLFRSSKQLGVENIQFTHAYHGFYIDAETGKKLSSREGASNVNKLIEETVDYFKEKYTDGKHNFSNEEIDDIGKRLGVGSIIFNDLLKDKKSPVRIYTNPEKMCQEFEKSGGAYVSYIICRAKKVLFDAGYEISENNLGNQKFSEKEKRILLKISTYPNVLKIAAQNDDPSKVIEFVLQLSRLFSSYYQDLDERLFERGSKRIINGKKYKLNVYYCVVQTLMNAMDLCNIEIPNEI